MSSGLLGKCFPRFLLVLQEAKALPSNTGFLANVLGNLPCFKQVPPGE